MSVKSVLKRKLVLIITILLAVTGVGLLALLKYTTTPSVSHDEIIMDYSRFIENLRATGTTVEIPDEVSPDVFSVPRKMIIVNGESVQVWEYPDVSAAFSDAASVSPGGSSVCRKIWLGRACSKYTWIDTPHFYKAGRIIVLYVGNDSTIINHLTTFLGDQFAGDEEPINFTSQEITIRTPVSAPKSRFVWDVNAGAGSTFNLTPLNFDGFYYDLDNNAGSESFSIELGNPDNRSIKENDLKYSTTVSNIPFKYRQFGNYSMIGFMGERYFAGYSAESNIIRSPVNLLNHGLLLGILIDENVNLTLTIGGGKALGDSYGIWVEDMNVDEGIVQFSLTKNGEELDSRSVKAQDTYVFKRDIKMITTAGSVVHDNNINIGDLPIIAIHIDSILLENNVSVVRINGIFQLSDSYTKIESDSESRIYGIMKITNVSDKGISMSNMNSINLRYPYSTEYELYSIGIMRGFGLKVAESEILRFLVERESTNFWNGNYELRGAVYTESNPVMAWDGLNFEGFLYNLDSGNYSQKLEITNISGRTIPAHGLKYTAFVTEIPYTVTKKTGIKPSGAQGSYKAVGIGTEKYAAIEGKSRKLAKILVDKGMHAFENRIFQKGEIWQLGDGYSLTVKSVNASSSPRLSQLMLSRYGIELDEKWISLGSTYIYAPGNSSEENDLSVFVTYLHSVFSGEAGPDMIELRYTWLATENITEIKEGDRFGVFSVTDVEPDFIVLENDRAIDLTAGSCINLIENLGFVVADSDELRFYPSGGIKCDQSG